MVQNILITGGAGFIGSGLSLLLVARGHKVRVLDNLSPQIHGADPMSSPLFLAIRDKVEFFRGSVTSQDDMLKALAGIDTVVHLAAETGTGQSMYAIRHYANVNIGGTALMLDLIVNKPFSVKKIIVASSRAVYGEGKYRCPDHGFVFPHARYAKDMEQGRFDVLCPQCAAVVELVPTDEEAALRPVSVYGATKLAQEQLVLAVGKALGISALAFRYQNVYGPGQSLGNPYTGLLSVFSTQIRQGRKVPIFEDGKESRDFVFIDDVVAVTANGIEHEAPLNDVFNVGSGVATDVLTVAATLQQLLGKTMPMDICGKFRMGDIRHHVADLTKVRAVLKFDPRVSLREGLDRYVIWVKGEKIQTDRYEESLKELKAKGLYK
jgi:dTDP-L-rhamnose 4-epimerase